MSFDPTVELLSTLTLEDFTVKQNLHKLHLSHQHTFLPWKHFSSAHLTHIASLSSPADRREYIRSTLHLRERFPLGEVHIRDHSGTKEQQAESRALANGMVDNNLTRQEIIIDMTLGILGFCWTNELDAIKTSTFFSILYKTHQLTAEVAGPPPTIKQGYAYFEKELLRHSVERPPFSIAVFTPPEIEKLTRWTLETYFAQLKLYQYAFGTQNELEIQATNSVAECVDPLNIGTSLFSTDPIAQDWTLDWAKNYYPDRQTSKIDDDSTSSDGVPEAQLSATFNFDSSVGDDFRDDTTGIEFLASTKQSNADVLGRVTGLSGENENDPSAMPLLADPHEQALFDAAIARELRGLYKDFNSLLTEQQEQFAQRLNQMEINSNTTGMNTNRNTSAGSAPAGTTTTAPPSRTMKSRGKQ